MSLSLRVAATKFTKLGLVWLWKDHLVREFNDGFREMGWDPNPLNISDSSSDSIADMLLDCG
jgi:hypothetical protein